MAIKASTEMPLYSVCFVLFLSLDPHNVSRCNSHFLRSNNASEMSSKMRSWKKTLEEERNMPGRLTVTTWFFASLVLMFLTHGEAAPAGTVPLPLSCDFDHGMCGFSSQGNLPWKTTNHLYGTVLGGIPKDHTSGSGYYAYPDVHNFFIHNGAVGELVSPTFHHAGQVCVQFAAILTRDTPPLQVTVDHGGNTQKMGEASLASGHWETYNFSFHAQGDVTIHFVAQKVSSSKLTGLDDIKVQTCDSEKTTATLSVTSPTPSVTAPPTTKTTRKFTTETTTEATDQTSTKANTETTIPLTTPTTTKPTTHTSTKTNTLTTITHTAPTATKPATRISTKVTFTQNAATKSMINPTTATTKPTAIATMPTLTSLVTSTTASYIPTIRTTAPSSQTSTPTTTASTPTMSTIPAGHFTSSAKVQVTSATTEVTPSRTPPLLDGLWHVVLAMWREAATSSPGLGSSATQSPSHELGLLNKRHRLQRMSLDWKVDVEELE